VANAERINLLATHLTPVDSCPNYANLAKDMATFHIELRHLRNDPASRILFLRAGKTRILFVRTQKVFTDGSIIALGGFTLSRSRDRVPAVVTFSTASKKGVIAYA
jgi:hypothetical protein